MGIRILASDGRAVPRVHTIEETRPGLLVTRCGVFAHHGWLETDEPVTCRICQPPAAPELEKLLSYPAPLPRRRLRSGR